MSEMFVAFSRMRPSRWISAVMWLARVTWLEAAVVEEEEVWTMTIALQLEMKMFSPDELELL